MIISQSFYPSYYTLLVPPVVIVIIVFISYWREIVAYEWKQVRTKEFISNTFLATTQGMIAQAVGIIIVVYGIGISEPVFGLSITPYAVFSSTFIAAVLEEVVYRGILFSALDRRFGFWPAAVISSVVFAVSHHNYAAYLGYFLLGVVWCKAYKKTNNLGVVIAAHTFFNAAYFVVKFAQG